MWGGTDVRSGITREAVRPGPKRRGVPATSDPVLLLHGQPGGVRDWDRLRAAIGGRASTIAIYRPGWDGRGPASDLSGNVRAALAALDEHNANSAIVVGHSFGAAVAASMALSDPERVRALVLVAPAANVASLYRLDYLLAAPVAGYLGSIAALGGAGLVLAAAQVRRRIGEQLALDDRYLSEAGRALRAPSAWRTFYAEQRVLIRQLPDLEARLEGIAVPTRIVVGGHDWIVPISSAQRLATQIPAAELLVLARAGHLIPQQCPEQLAEVIISPLAPEQGQPTASSAGGGRVSS